MKLSTSIVALGALVEGRGLRDNDTLGARAHGNGVMAHGNKIICYYTNWSQYRPGTGKFYPEDIDASLCTHLLFSFAKVVKQGDGFGLAPYEWNDLDETWMEGMYTRFNKLKNKNPGLKTLIAVGGWNHGSGEFSNMVASEAGINSFVQNSMQFARENGFDGLDLDWEYPAKCSTDCSPASDAEGFRRLCEVYRQKINSENTSDKFLLSAAVGIGRDKVYDWQGESGTPSYEPKHLTDHLDFVNLMSYDMHGHWECETGHHALSHKIPYDDRLDGTTNLEWVLDNWIALGADPKKLALGLAAFGRSFALADENNNGYLAPAKSSWTGLCSGSPGPYTREGGYLAYYEVCEKVRSHGWSVEWLADGAVPYAHGEGDWVGYDNVESINYKVDMAKYYGLGGIMWWAIDIDDFSGQFCGEGRYPLINASKKNWLHGGSPPDVTTDDTPSSTDDATTATTEAPDTSDAPSTEETTTKSTTKSTQKPPSGDCVTGKYYPDPNDCGGYFVCDHGYEMVQGHCGPGLYWDTKINACNWPASVDCCDGKRPCSVFFNPK